MSMQSNSNPSLPNDLLLSCFARVSRLYYPTLSLVSKRFRSLLASPEFYKARSLLKHTETCLYVYFESFPRSCWYTLSMKPNQTLTNDTSENKKNKSSVYVLATVPISSSPRVHFPGLVAVGSNIYNIEKRSSNVSILDCWSHTWSEAPSLPVKLVSLSASVLDGNIYVGGCSYKDGDSSDSFRNTLEVFDTRTQAWDVKTIPCSETNRKFYYSRSACMDGKFYVKSSTEAVAYNTKESRWDLVGPEICNMIYHFYCEIENVLYSASYGVLRWFDFEVSMWKCLLGLEGLPEFPRPARIRLADHGGKLAVFWEGDLFLSLGGFYKTIWYAEIVLERRQTLGEIWGKVEWVDDVLTVPKSYNLVKALAVTI